MIHLCYSNRTEALLETLVDNLEAQRRRSGASLFDRFELVVPNRNVETYLKLGIARQIGLAANIRVRFLRRFLAELAETSSPDSRVIEATHLQGMLLELLHDDALLRDRELAPVRAYLLAAGERPDAVDLRRYQLSAQLAPLFEEYGLSRPEMVAGWPHPDPLQQTGEGAGGEGAGGEGGGTERWQRRLWVAMMGAGGIVERRREATGIRWLTLPGLMDAVRPQDLKVEGAIHVFGISYVARAFHRMFEILASIAEIHLYTLNPCREFWEDVRTDRERQKDRFPRRGKRATVARQLQLALPAADPLDDPRDTALLRLWGRPGRENIRLLDQLTGFDSASRFADPLDDGATLLHQLQHDILERAPERTSPDASTAPDDSIVFTAAPGIRRELESVAAEIWSLLKADDAAGGAGRLRFNDIAVVVPAQQQEIYLAHVGAVFGECHDIPHSIIDLPLSAESRIAEAIELLLALPLGGFTRQELLPLCTHPAVMARFPGAEPGQWLGWCEALGVVHGADHGDHRDTYIERDLYNWDQGMKRLCLGSFMEGGHGDERRPIELGGAQYLPCELPSGDVASAMGFALLVRSLIADARFAATARLPLPRWIAFLRSLVSTYVSATSDEDDRTLVRCLRELQRLEEIDVGTAEVSYRIPCELARAALGALRGGRGQYLADGVAVSSFVPMRAIPFKVVFAVGLGEGLFPAPDRPSPLDLRAVRRRPGDVSPREQDRYMLLETLLCARDRLHLSWVARDELTGDALEPSSVVVELRELLSRGYLTPTELARRTRRPPLRRDQDPATCEASPAAAREASARALGEDLRRAAPHAAVARDMAALRTALPPATWEALGRPLGMAKLPDPVPFERGTTVVSMTDIRRFLECPMQGWARFWLKLRETEDDDDDVLARQDEAFETTRLDRTMLLRAAFLAACDGVAPPDAPSLDRTYGRHALLAELKGSLPTGPFGQAERLRHRETLLAWREAVAQVVGADRPPRIEVFRFGRADEHASVDRLLDPVLLDVPLGPSAAPVRVEIFGQTQAIIDRPRTSIILSASPRKGDALHKEHLRGFLDHVLLAAAGAVPPGDHAILVCTPEGAAALLTMKALAKNVARGYLAAVIGDMLAGPHEYLLPCEVAFKHRREKARRPVKEIVEVLVADTRNKHSSHYGPVPQPNRFLPPPEDDALAMIDRRFRCFFEVTGQ